MKFVPDNGIDPETGRPPGNVTACIFLLKGLKKERYGDKVDVTQKWDGNLDSLDDARLAELKRSMRAKLEVAKRELIAQGIDPETGRPLRQIAAASEAVIELGNRR